MKTFVILLIWCCIALKITFSQDGYRININKLNIPIDNRGVIADVNIPPDGWGGRFEEATFMFSGGFFISGYNSDTLWACGQVTSSLVENFIPGNVGGNQFDPRYKIYVVKKSDPPFGPAWQEWAFAVEIGAEFYDGNEDGIYTPVDVNGNGEWDTDEDRPDIMGDLTTWCVFNDGQPSARRLRFAGVHPQGIEIQQTVFAYNLGKMYLQNAIFIRYKIFNAGNNNPVLDSVYFSVWADGDIGDNFGSDLVGTDTLVSSIYTYKNVPDADSGYGANPPAFFKSFLQGPHTYIPGVTFIDNNFNGTYEDSIDTPLDSATNFMGSIRGIQWIPGATNLNLTSTMNYHQSDPWHGDPSHQSEARNYMLGLNKFGEIIDPCTWQYGEVFGGINCSEVNPYFIYSGDPTSNVGWINTMHTNQKTILNTGPFTLRENESVYIIAAYIVGRGDNPLSSIPAASEIATFVQQFYQSNFDDNLVDVNDDMELVINDYVLYQNYPNPFNPFTKISYQIPQQGFVTLKIFDLLGREVATLVNEEKPEGRYAVDFSSKGLASGVYIYTMKVNDFVDSKKMILLR